MDFELQRFVTEGTNGNDTLNNTVSSNVIYAYSGNDYIYNSASTVTVYAGDGNDTVRNLDGINYVTVDGGYGNDTIVGRAWRSSLNGGDGADLISIGGGDVDYTTIRGGYGNDTIYFDTYDGRNLYQYASGDGSDVLYYLNAADTIHVTSGSVSSAYASGSDVILNVGSGYMTLKNKANDYFYLKTGSGSAVQTIVSGGGRYINITSDYSSYSGTDYNDTIYAGDGDYVTVNAGGGADTVSGYYYSSKIYGGAGNDYLSIGGSSYSNTVDGGDGNDTISIAGGSVSGGAGDDRISMTGSSGTVRAGTGNDMIYGSSLYSHLYQYYAGDGNDIIYNVGNYDTVSIGGASSWSTITSGSNVIVSVAGSGNMTLVGASGKSVRILPTVSPVLRNTVSGTTFNGTADNDTMSNTGATVTVYAGSGSDSIYNGGSYSKIYAGDGADTVYNGASSVTVDGGAGNDTIIGRTWRSSLNGGDGADVISIGGGDVDGTTIIGGYGNDIIYGDGYDGYNTYVYAAGDGYDTVYSAMANDTLRISSGSYTTTRSGSDFLVSVTGGGYSGAVTFKNTSSVNIYPSLPVGVTLNNTISSTSVNGTSYNDSIRNTGSYVTISTGDGADTVYNYLAHHSYIDLGTGNDSVYLYEDYTTLNAGDGDDTVNVAGYATSVNGGAGSDRINVSNSYWGRTIKGGAGNDAIYGNSLSSSGAVYQYTTGDGYDTIYNFSSIDTLSISGSYYTVQSGRDLIYYTGASSSLYSASGSVRLVNYTPGGKYISNSASNTVLTGTAYDDTIYNSASYVTINALDGNDSINSNYGTYGNAYVTINAGGGNDTIVGRYGDSSIYGGAGDDRISMSGDVDRATINGGTGNDVVYLDGYLGYDGRNMIQYASGDGNDTVYGFKSSDSVSISGSYTTVQSGSDFIYNVGSGSLRLVNYEPAGIYITNSTSYRTLTGTAFGDTIKNIYNSGGDYVSISAGAGNDTIYTDYSWHLTIDAGDGDDTVTVYRGYNNTINGGAGADKIILSTSNGIQTVRGGAGSDTIYGDTVNSSGVVYVYQSGDGNDVIYNFHSNDTVTGATYSSVTSGRNVILNMSGGGSVTLVGATIPTFAFTEGADSYTNTTANTLLSALGGNDTVKNSASKVTIDALDGDDRISNTGTSLTAYGGAGNDSVYNSGDYSYLDLGDGADSLYAYDNDNDNVTVNAGAGADVISGSFYGSKIYGGYGDDRISVLSGTNTIDGGDGDDTISAYGGSVSGGAGADRISLNGSYSGVKVNGGTGNDSIYGVNNSSLGAFYQYAYGDGSDVIYNYNSVDTISIVGSSQYTTLISGSNKIVSVIGSGAMTLSGASSKTLNVTGGTYVPNTLPGLYVVNSTSSVTVNGTANDDTIENIYSGGGDTVSISAGAGDDTIYNNYGYYVTIDAGAGDDTITSYRGSSNSIDGGAGADKISLSSSNGLTVVKGGTGNDTIYGDTAAQIYQYANGDGYDSIVGYSENDTITITGGDWSKSTVGNDVVIKITNSNSTVQTGAITLSGAKGKAINVYPAIAPEPVPTPTPNPNPTVTQQEVIQKFMGVLDTVNSDGISRLNQAVSVASGGYFNGINAAINQMVSDCQNASSANDFLLNYCGINLSNSDTGAITGSDAGGSATKTATSIVPESGSVNNFTGNSFTTNGLTVKLAAYPYWDWYGSMSPNPISYSSLTNNTERYIWQAFQTWWDGASLNLIAQSYGDNFSFGSNSSAPVKEMYFGFVRENSGMMAVTGSWSNSNGANTQLAMAVNMSNYHSLIIGNSDGKMSDDDGFYLDRVLAHEFTHAVMAANINYFGGLPDLIAEGMAELTHGTDDDRRTEILNLASSPYALRNALSIYYDSYDSYAGGYMFLRYLARQSSDHSGSSSENMSGYVSSSNNASKGGSVTTQRGVSIKSAVLTANNTFDEDIIDLTTYPSTVTKVNATALTSGVMIIGNTKANSISAGKSNDTVSGNLGNDTIAGGAGNDMLMGDAGNDNIKGDAGNDTLSGGYGNDTLTGGAGSDVFVYVAGNDLVADYAAGQDKIKLAEENILSSSISGSNVVLTTGNGTVTVKGGKGKNITVIDKDGGETTTIYGGASGSGSTGISVSGAVLTATAAFTGDEIDLADYATNVTKVNASALSRGVSIVGNAKANSLKGGSGADTIFGGAGNDTVSLGGGADIYVYESGNDLIQDYAAGTDKIKLSGTSITSASISGSNVVLKTSSGNLTVKGAKNKAITVIDASGKETSQVYPISTLPAGISVSGATLTASTAFTGSEIDLADYASTVTRVNASALSRGVSIVGNAKANSIKGGKGADTIFGGAGNDTLYGGAGKDVFVYGSGDGKDVIADYAAGDKIKISSGTISKTAYSGQNVVFTVGSGTLTVKNGKGKAITITDASGRTSTKTYTTGVSYGSNGNAAVSWFTEDDTNFISASANLDEISAEKFSVTNVETPANYENLAQENPIVLVSSNK